MLARTWVRIAVSYILLVLATAGILYVLWGSESEQRAESALRRRLEGEARYGAYSAAPLLAAGAPITATNTLARDLARLFDARVTFIRPDGLVAGDSEQDPGVMENHATRPEVIAALAAPGQPGSSTRLSATVHQNLLYVAVAVTDPAAPTRVVGVSRVSYPTTSIDEARNALYSALALAIALVILPAVALGALLAHSIAGPISQLRSAAARFGAGDLTARAPLSARGEIGDLAREFNGMAERLSGAIHQRTTERNQMAAVLAHMHDGVIITDAHGAVEGLNPTAARMLSTTAETGVGRSLVEVTHSHELHQALRAALAEPEERRRLEIGVGALRVAAVVTAVPNPAGGPAAGLVVLEDVTELQRLERARRDFVANIGHELRTPLASIKLLVETLMSAIYDDPRATKDFLRRIDVEIDGLTQLVRELLELSRIESGQVELDRRPTPVREILERAAARLRAQAERAGLTLTVQVGPGLPPADVDAARVEQVLVNLIHNATKFTPRGGQIRIEAGREGEFLRVSVADTGAGIPPDDLPRIFERFYKVDKARAAGRQREGGTGLGLAIAKHIVQAHGGRIWAQSRPGAGATFFFTLPVAVSVPVKAAERS